MFLGKMPSRFRDIGWNLVQGLVHPERIINAVIDSGKVSWKILARSGRIINPVIDSGKVLWKKTKSLFKKYFAPIAHLIAFCLLLINLYVFLDEVCMMLKWIFGIDGKILLLYATALVGIIIFFIWMAYIPTFPIILSVIPLIILIIPLIIVIFDLPLSQKICYLLGTDSKNEAIKLIGLGVGGIFAAILAASFNRRAAAQEYNNELVRKGNDDVRFQDIVRDLGHHRATVRIAAFYRFLYLAEKEQDIDEKTKKLRQDIFEILCGCLRGMSSRASNVYKNEHEYQIERQALSDVLFKGKFRGDLANKKNFVPSTFSPDLHKVHLAELNLSAANLSGANLSDADLSAAKLSAANLSGANLSDAKLLDAKLLRADLLRADLTDADLTGADLTGAKLSGADLTDAYLLRANLSGAKLIRANLSGAKLTDANLLVANLTKAYLSNANLSNTYLSYAYLSNAYLSNADLSKAYLSKANLSNANLSYANLSNANLSKADLRQAQLKGANLHDTYSIENADFRGAKIGNDPITENYIPENKGNYYADWTDSPPTKPDNSPKLRVVLVKSEGDKV